MNIHHCQPADLPRVLELFEESAQLQRQRSHFWWGPFEEETLAAEICRGELYKVEVGNEIGCVFKAVLNDPVIWGEKDKDPALYLHRIASGLHFRGRGFMDAILKWSREYCRRHNRTYIRLDTWGLNQKLTDYYQKIGFRLAGAKVITKTDALPPHYSGILNLFEMEATGNSEF